MIFLVLRLLTEESVPFEPLAWLYFFYTVYTVQKNDDVLASDRKWFAGVTTMVQLLVGNNSKPKYSGFPHPFRGCTLRRLLGKETTFPHGPEDVLSDVSWVKKPIFSNVQRMYFNSLKQLLVKDTTFPTVQRL